VCSSDLEVRLFQNFKDTNTADDWIQASEYNSAVIR